MPDENSAVTGMARRVDTAVVLSLAGEHDRSTSDQLWATLTEATGFGLVDLVVDLAAVTFMDAATTGVLVRAHAALETRSRSLVVRTPSRCAARVLDICGLAFLVEPVRDSVALTDENVATRPPGTGTAARTKDASTGATTMLAHARGWRAWTFYAHRYGHAVLPADPTRVCVFLVAYGRGRKAATTVHAAIAIGEAHRLSGLPNPIDHEDVRRVLAGLHHTTGVALHPAAPGRRAEIERLVATAGDDVRGRRDRALILVGYLGALRRIELSALDVADLTVAPGGLVVRVGGSGRAQEGGGRVAILPYDADRTAMCPVRAVRDWQDSAGIVDGPLWRAVHRNNTRVLTGRLTTEAIADILRRHAMATTRTSGRGDLRSLQRT